MDHPRKHMPEFTFNMDQTLAQIFQIKKSTYLFQIPGADTAAIAAISVPDQTNGGRLCGRVLASATGKTTADASIAAGTVCGK